MNLFRGFLTIINSQRNKRILVSSCFSGGNLNFLLPSWKQFVRAKIKANAWVCFIPFWELIVASKLSVITSIKLSEEFIFNPFLSASVAVDYHLNFHSVCPSLEINMSKCCFFFAISSLIVFATLIIISLSGSSITDVFLTMSRESEHERCLWLTLRYKSHKTLQMP